MDETHGQAGGSDGDPRPHVVVIGAGFGGLACVRALAREPVRITLLDRQNHHLFQPLLYQVATAGLSAPQVAAPIRHVLRRQRNCTVLLGEVKSIDPVACVVRFDDAGEIGYDHLVLATGATHSYFGNDDWARWAPGLKTLDDALRLRQRMLLAFERAERAAGSPEEQALLTFVIVGGGPTGVELAGTLAEIARHTLDGEFRRTDPKRARVLLVEAGPRILSTYPEPLSEQARRQIEELGVDVLAGTRVTGIDERGVSIDDRLIEARTVIWAAGVSGSPLARFLGVPLDRAGRVPVAADLAVPGRPGLWVIGDLAATESEGRPVPGVAPAAEQMGRHVARNVMNALQARPTRAFRYVDKGSLATIGRHRGVAQIGRLRLSGALAWWAWLLVHVFFLIGFRNRLVVMVDWAWSYFTFARTARLILGREGGPGG